MGEGGWRSRIGPIQQAWWGWGMGIILRIALESLSSQNWREVLAYLRVLGKVMQWTEHPRKVVVSSGVQMGTR